MTRIVSTEMIWRFSGPPGDIASMEDRALDLSVPLVVGGRVLGVGKVVSVKLHDDGCGMTMQATYDDCAPFDDHGEDVDEDVDAEPGEDVA